MYNPDIQACLDAVTEHQRLKALMKGEWVKGLLPQASVRADYTVQRIRGGFPWRNSPCDLDPVCDEIYDATDPPLSTMT